MKKLIRCLMYVMCLALYLCGCGDADPAPQETWSEPAPSDAFKEKETEHFRMSCQEVVCKQDADVEHTQADTGTHLGTLYEVRCWWPCTTYKGQSRQNVWITFKRFTGECFERRLITQESADSYACEDG